MNIKVFRAVNRLTQSELGYYLGVTKSFVSRVESGKENFGPEKMERLLNNDMGWDVTMLTADSVVGDIIGNKGSLTIDHSKRLDVGAGKKEMGLLIKIAELSKEIEQLKERLADKDAQIQEERKRFMDLLEIYKTK